MKTYYQVTTTFDDRGRVTAAVTAKRQADKAPAGSFKSTARADVYTDWFGSRREAEEFLKEAMDA